MAVLGGADPRILERTPASAYAFAQMALILLGTAVMAGISMWFALTDGMHVSSLDAIPVAVIWGAIILNLDRFLTSNMKSSKNAWQALGIAWPRILMALLIGVVISTPLVLRVFANDIAAQVAIDQGDRAARNVEILAGSAQKQELDRATAALNDLEAQQQTGVTDADITSPDVTEAELRIQELDSAIETQQAVVDEANKLYQCERYGSGRDTLKDPSKCSPKPGPNGLAPQYERDAAAQQEILDQLSADLGDARNDLLAAKSTVLTTVGGVSEQRRQEAAEDLPGAQAWVEDAEKAYGELQEDLTTSAMAADGMLSQLTALHTLSGENVTLFAAHAAIALLFVMIELMPVIVKMMTSVGPPSQYEAVATLEVEASIEEAKVTRNDARARLQAESQKRAAIEDDMRAREQTLGIKANAYVAEQMETIVESALQAWTKQVAASLAHSGTTTSRRQGAANHQGAFSSTPQPSSQVASSSPNSVPAGHSGTAHSSGTFTSSAYKIPNGQNLQPHTPGKAP